MKDKYYVKEICALCNLTRRQLLYCEDIGMLDKVPRDSNGYRYYTRDHILTLQNICELRELGYSFDELFGVMHNNDVLSLRDYTKSCIAKAQKELEKSVAVYDKRIKNLIKILEATYIVETGQGVATTDLIEEVEFNEKNVLAYDYIGYFIDDTIEFYKKYKELDDEIVRIKATKISNKLFSCTNHYDVEQGAFNMSPNPITVFYEIDEAGCDSPYYRVIPGFRALTTISVGDFGENLIKNYQRIFAWAKQNNLKLSNTSYEENYLDLSWAINSDLWATRIYIPICSC